MLCRQSKVMKGTDYFIYIILSDNFLIAFKDFSGYFDIDFLFK